MLQLQGNSPAISPSRLSTDVTTQRFWRKVPDAASTKTFFTRAHAFQDCSGVYTKGSLRTRTTHIHIEPNDQASLQLAPVVPARDDPAARGNAHLHVRVHLQNGTTAGCDMRIQLAGQHQRWAEVVRNPVQGKCCGIYSTTSSIAR